MKKNRTLLELLIGVVLVGILSQIVCLIFFKQHLYHAVGLWTGVCISAGMAIHMQRSIEDGLDSAASTTFSMVQVFGFDLSPMMGGGIIPSIILNSCQRSMLISLGSRFGLFSINK